MIWLGIESKSACGARVTFSPPAVVVLCERCMQVFWTILRDLPSRLLIAAVRLYQITLSPFIGRSCRFQPTCSNYMIGAVEKYGFLRGGWRGIRRLARCHPFCAGGYDPP